MELQHIELENLKPAPINVRKKGGKNVADLVPSIRSLGLLQPLLVRSNCEGYEIIAGQRRYHALVKLADEGAQEPIPCIIMEKGDDAKAIEASLAENVARLPMDEIDQYKAFVALLKQGNGVADIASQFGITERLVKQRLAIANLISPILNAYGREEICTGTIRCLTLASKSQQKKWWKLFQSDEYAPQGNSLKEWLFGGANIAVESALFNLESYNGSIISDLFEDERYFADSEKFWLLQNEAIAQSKEQYLANGWGDVVLLEIGEYWNSWEFQKTSKKNGGKIYIQIARDGDVTFHEGYLDEKQAKHLAKAARGESADTKVQRPELTKPMQNYLDLHRHASVRAELLNHQGIALRLAVAQIIAGSVLWSVQADPQKAANDALHEGLVTNKAQDRFAEERQIVSDLLGNKTGEFKNIVPTKGDWQNAPYLYEVFSKLIGLDDKIITRILTFVVAETLPSGSAMVEALGNMFNVEIGIDWQVDNIFFDLLRDKEAINAMLKQVGGRSVADAHIASTAKVQKQIIRDFLEGTRNGGKKDWQPKYAEFPMGAYTKRGGIEAIDNWKAVKKHFA